MAQDSEVVQRREGYGFITQEGGEGCLRHYSAVQAHQGFKSLAEAGPRSSSK